MVSHKKILYILILFSSYLYSSVDFNIAAKRTLQVNQAMDELRFLHFTFSFKPVFYKNILYELFYSINYKEVGSNQIIKWVKLYDGRILNINGFNYQWKGPFPGIRGIEYKFYIELQYDSSNANRRQLIIHIFSTNPELDAKYYDSYYKSPPFEVKASYSALKSIKEPLKIYSTLSSIYSVVKVVAGKVSSTQNFIISTAIQEIAIYAIDKISDKFPISINIKCNVCGKEYLRTLYNFEDFIFECQTPGCHNKARIFFPR